MMPDANPNIVHYYEITIDGHLDDARTSWFSDMCVTLLPTGQAIISGIVVDQAALFGILIRIRDMGIPLISVIRTEHHEHRNKE